MLRKLLASFFITALFSSTVFAYFTAEGCEHPFIDTLDHWGQQEICLLYQKGNIQGFSERNFAPEKDITRAEFLKISLLNLGYNVVAVQSSEFTDSNPGDWHYKYGTFARSKGFLKGYNDGSWKPNNPISRAEAIQLIVDIAGINEYPTEYQDLLAFWDVTDLNWFAEAVHLSIAYNIVKGYADGGFYPYKNITRAEAAAIVNRTWEALYNQYPVGLQR